ncbi:MAG: hypothetical protein M3198_07600 [Actinomycetota bacterium]|nr:hypothetical protein [Actinomycetota bacterium]
MTALSGAVFLLSVATRIRASRRWGTNVDVDAICERLLASPGVVFLVGGIDSGKTTLAMELARRAEGAGISPAIVDADIGQSTIGPPTTVGLKLCAGMQEIGIDALREADALAFVGSLSPRGHLLPLAVGAGELTSRARAAGCRLIIVDSTGLVSGIAGQLLKFYKMHLVRPDYVIAMKRGGELDPIIGIAQRFTPAQVFEMPVPPQAVARSADERASLRERQFAAYFERGSSRWRVKPTVFMPTLPPGFDLARLEGLVVGMEDGEGSCLGIGILDYERSEDALRMTSPVSEGVRGLRLGSVRIDAQGRSRGSISLRNLFGSE